ncbi:hypothetical protein [Halomonas sp. WWR20]
MKPIESGCLAIVAGDAADPQNIGVTVSVECYLGSASSAISSTTGDEVDIFGDDKVWLVTGNLVNQQCPDECGCDCYTADCLLRIDSDELIEQKHAERCRLNPSAVIKYNPIAGSEASQ